MNGGSFAIIRSGISEHLIASELGFSGLGVYTVIHLQADFRTGIWRGSAPRLHATAPRGMSLRDIQREIENLTRIGFLRPFHVQGARGNYPVLIHKYEVKLGALRGKRLNAWGSESWRKPLYESCAEDDGDTVAQTRAEGVAEAAPIHEAGVREVDREAGKIKTRTQTQRALPPPREHQRRIENRNQRLVKDLELEKEICAGGPFDLPRSLRDAHPDVVREVAKLAKRKYM